jgi:hypothetical protein
MNMKPEAELEPEVCVVQDRESDLQREEVQLPPDEIPVQNFRAFAAAIVTQALKDAQEAKLERKLDAVLWLAGPDFPIWADLAGLTTDSALDLLTSGRAARAIPKIGRTHR